MKKFGKAALFFIASLIALEVAREGFSDAKSALPA